VSVVLTADAEFAVNSKRLPTRHHRTSQRCRTAVTSWTAACWILRRTAS